MGNTIKIAVILVLLLNFAGCTVIFQRGRSSDMLKINELAKEVDNLSRTKALLEEKLKKEIDAKEVTLSMQDRGLVVTFLSEVLFDSGKAVIKKQAYESLDKVSEALSSTAAGMNVGIEGHTDNQPIKVSGWESNWDLSGARAKSVLNYLIKKNISPARLSFIGYGEYRPVDSNDTSAGRQRNRRVEIVILPNIIKDKDLAKEKTKTSPNAEGLKETKENLK
ncbi:MAG: OmpA family protein [Candidatus Omnitrophica bacterium]|nr:OmpA family protein [Candidatus Omnitrophota bacterium]